MALRDHFIAPAPGAAERPARARRPAAAAAAPGLGVLALARDLPAIAAAVGLVAARRAALVYLHASSAELTVPLRPPARAAATRLAASLGARGLSADVRGRLVLTHGDASPDAAARALAAAGTLPTVLAIAVRDPAVDGLLSAQDAILVALPPSADPALAALALSSAHELCRSATAVTIAVDAVTRALALGGWRAPRPVREAVEELLG